MRTQGTFQRVYEAARSYYNGEDVYGGRPIDPVVRREGKTWMLESALSPEGEDCNFSCSLEDFDNYWYEMYKTDNPTITTAEIDDFVQCFSQNQLDF